MGKDARGVIYFEELKKVGLVELVEDWVMMNKVGSIMEGEVCRGYKPDQLLLVKEIKNKIKEIETLINKLEETEIDRLERGKDKEE
ncbi:MAG: hypothetical protein ACK53L_10160 [Pirellulaceae bacterium]